MKGTDPRFGELNWSIPMSDLFGSFWDIDKDIIFPNDKIKLELTIDNKWLV
jgi:hypothetical protein